MDRSRRRDLRDSSMRPPSPPGHRPYRPCAAPTAPHTGRAPLPGTTSAIRTLRSRDAECATTRHRARGRDPIASLRRPSRRPRRRRGDDADPQSTPRPTVGSRRAAPSTTAPDRRQRTASRERAAQPPAGRRDPPRRRIAARAPSCSPCWRSAGWPRCSGRPGQRDPLGGGRRHRDQPLRVRPARRDLGGLVAGAAVALAGDQPAGPPAATGPPCASSAAIGAGLLVGLARRGGDQPDVRRQRDHRRDRRHHARPRPSSAARSPARATPAVGRRGRRRRAGHADLRGRVQPRPGPAASTCSAPATARRRWSAPPKWVSRTESLLAGLLAGLLAFGYLTWSRAGPPPRPGRAAPRWPAYLLAGGRPGPAPAAHRGDHPDRRPDAARPGRRAQRGGPGGPDRAGHLADRQRHLGALRRRADRDHRFGRTLGPTRDRRPRTRRSPTPGAPGRARPTGVGRSGASRQRAGRSSVGRRTTPARGPRRRRR